MATQSPFLMLDKLAQSMATKVAPPDWAITEAQRRMVLLLNHVLTQEEQALARLRRQQGRIVLVQWSAFNVKVIVTPAGLFEIADLAAVPDLTLSMTQSFATDIVQTLLRGDKPAVRIEGDVQLAAEINWLVDNVRWDLEEDLARVIGDVPAHSVGRVARRLSQALGEFLIRPSTADRAQT